MRMIVEFIGDLALQCRSPRAKALFWGALLLLVVASVAIIKAPLLLWDQRWLAACLTLAATIVVVIAAAGMITAGVHTEMQASTCSKPHVGKNWSTARWLSVILVTLLIIPPPIVVIALALLLLRQRNRRRPPHTLV